MGAFVIRRIFGMLLVLLAVSFIVYLIFIVIPGGDPAQRIAGKVATHANIVAIHHKLGLDQPFIVQWFDLMKALFTAKLVSYYDGTNVVNQIAQGLPATFSLCIGAGIIWLGFGVLVGTLSAVTAGRFSDRAITALALVGISLPVAWLGLILRYLF